MATQVDACNLVGNAYSCFYFYLLVIRSNLIDRRTSVSKVSFWHRRVSAVTFRLCIYVSRQQMILGNRWITLNMNAHCPHT
jgi:hypothetical protein